MPYTVQSSGPGIFHCLYSVARCIIHRANRDANWLLSLLCSFYILTGEHPVRVYIVCKKLETAYQIHKIQYGKLQVLQTRR